MANIEFGSKLGKTLRSGFFIFAVTGLLLFIGMVWFLAMKNRAAKEDLLSGLPKASSIAERALFEASRGQENTGYRTGVKIKSSSSPMVVSESRFDSVSEPPKSLMEALQDMAGGGQNRKKPPAVFMKDGDLDRKIRLPSFSVKPPRVGSDVPALRYSEALPTAPVTYKLFRDSSTWRAFTDSHDINRLLVDFASQAAVILVSLSEFPSGIFHIVKIRNGKTATVIQYRVNPFSMSPKNPDANPDAYSAGVIDRPKLPVVLEQVP